MSVSDPSSSRPRHVVAGPTREDAAEPFGLDHSDMFLTSYEQLGSEVDLDQMDSVDLAAGEGLYAALDHVGPQLTRDPGFVLRMVYTVGTSAPLAAVLERHHLVIADVQRRAQSLVLTLEAASAVTDGRTLTILSAVDAGASGPAAVPDELAAAAAAEQLVAAAPASGPARTKRPRPPLVGHLHTVNRWRSSRRRLGAVVVAVAVLALVLLVIGLLSGTSAPVVVILLVGLVVLVAGSAAVLLVAVLLLARQVHAQTGRLERMVLRNRGVVHRRTTTIDGRLGEIANLQRRLPFMFDYLEAMAASSSTSAARLTDQLHLLEADAATLHLDTQRQVQALLNLHQMLEIDHRVPPMGGWAAAPDFDVLMVEELLDRRPRTVVECGSGTTTLLLALAVRQHALPTRVVALEHLPALQAETQKALRQHGVTDVAEVRLAPLAPTSVPGHPTPWYAESALGDLDDIGLLVVDGPPGTTGEQARFPAVPLLLERLAADCVIVVDDLVRPDDLAVVHAWKALLPDFEYTQLDTFQKRVGVFRR